MSSPAALADIKVLDLSRILAGPWSAQTLADLGADVIKVEQPGRGDDTRHWGPPFIDDSEDADAAYFTACNRNKRSICVDFSNPEGAEILRGLAAQSDVLIENYKVGGLAKYGLDYKSIKQLNPGIVYCSVTGFGQTGPYAHRSGYDFLIQGMGGLMSVTGQADGVAGAEPMKVGVAITDLFTGMYATVSVLAALRYRDVSGEGQYIDCSLLDTQVAMLANQGANWLAGGMVPSRLGNHHPNIVPYSVFPAKDGHVVIACGNDKQFVRLCNALDLPELTDDARFENNAARIEHRETLNEMLARRTGELSRQELISRLEAASVSCGPINTVRDVFDDAQVQTREMVVNMERGGKQTVPVVAYPARMSETPAGYRYPPPLLGEGTREILESRLGFDDEKIRDLTAQGIVA